MSGWLLAGWLLAGLASAQAAAPGAAAAPAPESEEAAIDRLFYPAFQLRMMIAGPMDKADLTRNAYAALGKERFCRAYREAWPGAFDRHFAEWNQAYRAAVRSVVPPEALRAEPRRFMDPAVVDAYSGKVVAALQAAKAEEIARKVGIEILTELVEKAAAAPPGAAVPPDFDPAAPGGLAAHCGATMEYLERRPNAF